MALWAFASVMRHQRRDFSQYGDATKTAPMTSERNVSSHRDVYVHGAIVQDASQRTSKGECTHICGICWSQHLRQALNPSH